MIRASSDTLRQRSKPLTKFTMETPQETQDIARDYERFMGGGVRWWPKSSSIGSPCLLDTAGWT